MQVSDETGSSRRLGLRARLAMIALPYVRHEFLGWGKVLRSVGAVQRPGVWRNAPSRVVRGKTHRYLMNLDLSDPWDRRTYFLARFVELETELFVRRAIRLGDTVIDVGANCGMFMLTASQLVGVDGRVHAVEPNRDEAHRIEQLLELNSITNVKLHEVALAESASEATLQILDGFTGLATLAELDDARNQRVTSSRTVQVECGDDLLGDDIHGNTLLKVDVEGFECKVLRGCCRLLERVKPAVLAEVEPEWLERAGDSADRLFAILTTHGYLGYLLWTRRKGLGQQLILTPVCTADELVTLRAQKKGIFRNTVWLHSESVFRERLSSLIVQ